MLKMHPVLTPHEDNRKQTLQSSKMKAIVFLILILVVIKI